MATVEVTINEIGSRTSRFVGRAPSGADLEYVIEQVEQQTKGLRSRTVQLQVLIRR